MLQHKPPSPHTAVAAKLKMRSADPSGKGAACWHEIFPCSEWNMHVWNMHVPLWTWNFEKIPCQHDGKFSMMFKTRTCMFKNLNMHVTKLEHACSIFWKCMLQMWTCMLQMLQMTTWNFCMSMSWNFVPNMNFRKKSHVNIRFSHVDMRFSHVDMRVFHVNMRLFPNMHVRKKSHVNMQNLFLMIRVFSCRAKWGRPRKIRRSPARSSPTSSMQQNCRRAWIMAKFWMRPWPVINTHTHGAAPEGSASRYSLLNILERAHMLRADCAVSTRRIDASLGADACQCRWSLCAPPRYNLWRPIEDRKASKGL
jgi:hypothetical protein